MVFSSLSFLTCALPIALALYYVLPRRLKNHWLLVFSLLFYAWGEPVYLLLMLGSITFNYLSGLGLGRAKRPAARRVLLAFTVAVNIGALVAFKYLAFFAGLLNRLPGLSLAVPQIALPIGISFYTFQALSYAIDVYRGEVPPQKSWAELALYVSFFPQLIAGPILRYQTVAEQISRREETLEKFSRGLRRFVVGLGKKVLIANAVARVADEAFAAGNLTARAAWLGAIAYALQIYFDFSGYSDMAIGLGAMFGFDYPENFNDPYVSLSVREFWRRWHISLSTWFRDYLYIPLGGSRCGRLRHVVNLMLVFLATGLWHGAGSNFLVWGLYYGVLCSAEAWLKYRGCERAPVRILQHALALTAILVGWVIFRADTLGGAAAYLRGMLVGGSRPLQSLTPRAAVAIAVGCVGSTALPRRLLNRLSARAKERLSIALIPALLLLCLMALASDTYNPFIYFRF